jgi:organic radical activating enzyme
MERSFKRIYIEITNICNLSCPFAPLCGGRRIMEPRAFSHILKEIGPTCKNILLHVKGEPLLSPYLPEILSLCEEKGFFVTLTTNGVLLSERAPLLCERAPAIRGVNWSLQSFVHFDRWRGLFEPNLAFCEKLALEYGKTAVLRLWGGRKEAEMKELLLKLAARFHLPEEEMGSMEKKRNHTLAKAFL